MGALGSRGYYSRVPAHTLSTIRALLASHGLTPRHRFGQNFLIDLNLLNKVVDAAEVGPADVVLEIGPGTGSLTECLLERGAQVIAVEIDRGLQELLRVRLGTHPCFTLIAGDALASKHRLNPEMLAALARGAPQAGGSRKLVANLPYQIATPLIIELLLADCGMSRLTCTIQREVGLRLCATPNDDDYGPLSVIAQTLANVRIETHLPPAAFWPRPEVDSLLVTLLPLPRTQIDVPSVAEFVALVRGAFLHRRKSMRRIARDWGAEAAAALAAVGISEMERPEALAPVTWQALSRALARRQDSCSRPARA